jgi:hypothetical protein
MKFSSHFKVRFKGFRREKSCEIKFHAKTESEHQKINKTHSEEKVWMVKGADEAKKHASKSNNSR